MHPNPGESLQTIPIEKMRDALLEAAVPGVFGKVSIDLYLTTEAVALCDAVVTTRFSQQTKPHQPSQNKKLEDPRREFAISRALHSIGERLKRRACLVSVDFHFADGELLKYDVEHVR